MLDVAGHRLTGERVRALYRFRCSAEDARGLAEFLCHEHSLELSASVLPDGFLAREIVGRIESLQVETTGTSLCWISYARELASGGFTTLLNLLMGNAGFVTTVELVDFELPKSMMQEIGGPRFGVEGIRKLTGVSQGPLGATALKPLGASAKELAEIAKQMALAKLDIIKEDDGISTQIFAPFHERVERCAAAIAEVNAKTGKKTLYFPNITGPSETLVERALYAKKVGATGVEILPGHVSFDALRMIASLPDLALPVMSHCALTGAFTRPPNATLSMAVAFGLLPRIAGADLSIMTSFGGRFNIPPSDCAATAFALKKQIEGLLACWPMPGGGIHPHQLGDVTKVFGSTTVFLVSGALFGKDNLTQTCAEYMNAVRAAAETAGPDIA